MKSYEFTVIFDANDEKTGLGIEKINAQFANCGVNVAKQEDLGVKILAYEIKKQNKGHYYYYELEADPQTVNKMSAEFLLDGNILKFLFICK